MRTETHAHVIRHMHACRANETTCVKQQQQGNSDEIGSKLNANADSPLEVPEVYRDLTEAQYEAEALKWRNDPQAPKNGPLNVQQRMACRSKFQAAQLRARGRRQNQDAKSIADTMKDCGVPIITLVMGKGGAGKSAIVHSLCAEMGTAGLGAVVVTAYTGVLLTLEHCTAPNVAYLIIIAISVTGAKECA